MVVWGVVVGVVGITVWVCGCGYGSIIFLWEVGVEGDYEGVGVG